MILVGDSLERLRGLESGSVDAIVTDPPYGLGGVPRPAEVAVYLRGADLRTGDFMCEKWDLPPVAVWQECFRALKPGRILLSFGGTRTFDLISLGLRLAGFLPVDTIQTACLSWVHGQGMPKGRAQLKPAWEPILVVRKPGPLRPLGIDECRVGTGKNVPASLSRTRGTIYGAGDGLPKNERIGVGGHDPDLGRYPPNLLLCHAPECERVGERQVRNRSGSITGDEPSPVTNGILGERDRVPWRAHGEEGVETVEDWRCVPGCPVWEVGEQSGVLRARGNISPTRRSRSDGITGWGIGHDGPVDGGDIGTAARFFPNFAWDEDDFLPLSYQAKASRWERNAGVGRDEPAVAHGASMREQEDADREGRNGNHHRTVKPLALMRWLVRLVALPGELVLDPYLGSGSTACAALLEGRRCDGIEREPEYARIAEARIAHWGRVARASATEPSTTAEVEDESLPTFDDDEACEAPDLRGLRRA